MERQPQVSIDGRMVTALPGKTTINLNAADEELLAFLIGDPVAAQTRTILENVERLLEGVDELGYLLARHTDIERYEATRHAR